MAVVSAIALCYKINQGSLQGGLLTNISVKPQCKRKALSTVALRLHCGFAATRWYAKKAWLLLYSDLSKMILTGSPYLVRISHPPVPSLACKQEMVHLSFPKRAQPKRNCTGAFSDRPDKGTKHRTRYTKCRQGII